MAVVIVGRPGLCLAPCYVNLQFIDTVPSGGRGLEGFHGASYSKRFNKGASHAKFDLLHNNSGRVSKIIATRYKKSKKIQIRQLYINNSASSGQ